MSRPPLPLEANDGPPLLDDAEQVNYRGCLLLAEAFWRQVRADVLAGKRNVRDWVLGPEFSAWASVCFASTPPRQMRQMLLREWGRGEEGL